MRFKRSTERNEMSFLTRGVHVFKLLSQFHFQVARLLLSVSIGVRLFILMALAVAVSVLLATTGVLGLGASKESLRSVYEDRMLPVQQLAEISKLMQSNGLLLQTSLQEISQERINKVAATLAADVIEKNAETVSALWDHYLSTPLTPLAQTLANRFAANRRIYLQEALVPAVEALRSSNYDELQLRVTKAQLLNDKATPDLQALSQLQFEAAQSDYAAGMKRFERTRLMALGALVVAVLFMSWLGWMLAKSIVRPLKKVIAVFWAISNNQYDTPITIKGKDEISKVMHALKALQTKLGINEKSLHQLAFYDPLTQLPNWRLLGDRLQQALILSTRTGLYGAVLMIDLDKFKNVNDILGHDGGDQLLVEVARRLQTCVRQADTVARLGSDVFVVMLVDLSPDEAQAALQASGIGEKILATLKQPYLLKNQLHHSSASMGLCLFLGQEASINDLRKRADSALRQAKSSEHTALRLFDPQILASLQKRIALESELRDALANQQLKLYYQIQIDNRERVLGAEVLLRWEHPQHGLIFPDQFISIAEESGLIVPIGEWVLQTACEQLKSWAHHPLTAHFTLAVNVSARQFRQPDFVAVVCRALAHTCINPLLLKLELTESLVLHNMADTIDKMKALNQQGIHFSMDDFGTGYSSLSQLTSLPIQQLKIDKSFVRKVASNPNDAVIVQTIIGMAHNLGMAVIAEGVETQEQRDCLERFGCLTYQGYLYGKPVPLAEFEELALGLVTA